MKNHDSGCCCQDIENLDFEPCEQCSCCEVTPEELARIEKIRLKMKPFRDHQKKCDDCAFFPLSIPCFAGAKLANPKLSDKDEASYLNRMKERHENCGWCE